jgi:hypothetical protein
MSNKTGFYFSFFILFLSMIPGVIMAQNAEPVGEVAPVEKIEIEVEVLPAEAEIYGPMLQPAAEEEVPAESPPPEVVVKEEAAPPVETPTEEPSEVATEAQSTGTDFNKIESLGLLSKASEGGFGLDFWKDSDRSQVMGQLQGMAASSASPAIARLIHGALLSSTDASLITNDVPLLPGGDLLTLRLEKLLEGGAYVQAFKLYSSLGQDPYHENLSRAGIMAMLFNGEKSLACLEVNTFTTSEEAPEFWTDLAAYCDASLSENPEGPSLEVLKDSKHKLLQTLATNKNFRFGYSPDTFADLGMLEKALLTAESRLDIGTLHYDKIPFDHIQPLLTYETLSDKDRVMLSAKAVSYGLMTPKELTQLYIRIAKVATKGQENPPTPTEDWQKLPFGYLTALNTEQEKQWEILRQILAFDKNYSTGAFSPFAGMLAQTTPVDPTLAEIVTAFEVFQTAGVPLPSVWTERAENLTPEKGENNLYLKVLAASYVARYGSHFNEEQQAKLDQAIEAADKPLGIFVKYIIENVDKQLADDDNAHRAYEKELSLTYEKDYVMPSGVVWDRLIKAGQNKAAGETILLSTVLLRNQELQDTYPPLVADILKATETVGLTDTSKDLAIAAILGKIE